MIWCVCRLVTGGLLAYFVLKKLAKKEVEVTGAPCHINVHITHVHVTSPTCGLVA